MTTDAKPAARVRAVMFNLPNQLTFLRLMLSVGAVLLHRLGITT